LSNDRIAASRESPLSSISLFWRGVSEKRATSEPEASADIHKSNTLTTSIMPTSSVKPKYIILLSKII
jgi:hypothetical protein